MNDQLSHPMTAFHETRLLSSGPLVEVLMAVKNALDGGYHPEQILIFDDMTGRTRDFDMRGSKAEIIDRLAQMPAVNTSSRKKQPDQKSVAPADETSEPRGRGRPKLGVVSREVTLLPRHWEWLSRQQGGASVVLRKLVDEARRKEGDVPDMRKARDVAYNFMSIIAGDLPGFEEAARALYAGDRNRFEQLMEDWPADIQNHAVRLAYSG